MTASGLQAPENRRGVAGAGDGRAAGTGRADARHSARVPSDRVRKPFSPAGLGNRFAVAAEAAGVTARLHGLRKAFCVYWAEQGRTSHQIATMAGHMTLSEVERYTDRRKIIQALAEGA